MTFDPFRTRADSPRTRWVVFTGLLALLVLAGLLVALRFPPLLRLDADIARLAYDEVFDRDWLITTLTVVADVGEPAVLRLLLVALAVVLWTRTWRRAAVFLVLSAAVTALASPLLKMLFGRVRPSWADPIAVVAGNSFPSGHATGGGMFATAMVLLTISFLRRGLARRLLIGLWLLIGLTVGLDRILLGVHYLSDVLAGWTLGTLLTLAVWELVVSTSAVAPVAAAGTLGPAPSRFAVVLNPTKVNDRAGFRALVADRAAACHWEPPRWYETSLDDPGRGITEQALDIEPDMVLAAGGDGTVREVSHELARTGVPIGVVPLGTGNLLARNLGLPLNAREALDVALTGHDRAVDVVSVHGDDLPETAFTVMAGLGLDAAIMQGAPDRLKRRIGWPAYVVSGLRQLLRYPLTQVEITVDDGPPVRVRARTVVVGNVGLLQAGFPLLPDARIDDGQLDVVVIAPGRRRDWVGVALRLVGRGRRTDEHLDRMQGRRVVVRSDRPQPRQLDGDPISPGRELHTAVQAGVLLVRVPR